MFTIKFYLSLFLAGEVWFIELLLKIEQLFETSKVLNWILFSSVLCYINFAYFPKSDFSNNLFLVLVLVGCCNKIP